MRREDLLKLFNDHSVDFVVIGALAFPVHGWARATLDMDLMIRPTRENATRALAALSEFGYDISDLTVESFLEKKTLYRGYAVEADIHPFVAGIAFEEVWLGRVKDQLNGVDVFFPSLEHLIRMKETANRARDREDLMMLYEIRRRNTGQA